MRVLIMDVSYNTPIVAEVTEAYVCDYITVDCNSDAKVSLDVKHDVVLTMCLNEDEEICVVLNKTVANECIRTLFKCGSLDLTEYGDRTFYNADLRDYNRLSVFFDTSPLEELEEVQQPEKILF